MKCSQLLSYSTIFPVADFSLTDISRFCYPLLKGSECLNKYWFLYPTEKMHSEKCTLRSCPWRLFILSCPINSSPYNIHCVSFTKQDPPPLKKTVASSNLSLKCIHSSSRFPLILTIYCHLVFFPFIWILLLEFDHIEHSNSFFFFACLTVAQMSLWQAGKLRSSRQFSNKKGFMLPCMLFLHIYEILQ